MNERRNPFLLRAAENIEADDIFVRLYNPDFLDMLDVRNIWGKPLFLRGAPGDGKTSLLHLFTPKPLQSIVSAAKSKNNKPLFRKLKGLGAVNEKGPQVIGAYLSCGHNYHTLEDLDVDARRKQTLFFSLMNARIALSFLLALSELKNLDYPNELEHVHFASTHTMTSLKSLPSNFSGLDLYHWAEGIEKSICDALDSFAPLTQTILPNHEALDVLTLFRNDHIVFKGKPLSERMLIMLDDVQGLASRQRALLYNDVIKLRANIGLWIAERLEALDPMELLDAGSKLGRDYGSIVNIAEYFSNRRQYESFALEITERRVQTSVLNDQIYLREALNAHIGDISSFERLGFVEDTIRSRIASYRSKKYTKMLDRDDIKDAAVFERVIILRGLEILIAREERRVQRSLFENELSDDMFERQLDASVRNAAEYFTCKEFDLPYYYGFSKLATLSSSNIEQLLWLSGELFEEVISTRLLGKSATPSLRLERQQRILKKAVRQQWDVLQHSLGRDVRNLLQAIGKFSYNVTNLPNAPYAPGVTGIAISMRDRDLLSDPEGLEKYPELRKLAFALTRAVANNHLQPRPDSRAKGDSWFVLYLNRVWCVQFDLPIGYGGWREQKLVDLVAWVESGSPNESKGARTHAQRIL